MKDIAERGAGAEGLLPGGDRSTTPTPSTRSWTAFGLPRRTTDQEAQPATWPSPPRPRGATLVPLAVLERVADRCWRWPTRSRPSATQNSLCDAGVAALTATGRRRGRLLQRPDQPGGAARLSTSARRRDSPRATCANGPRPRWQPARTRRRGTPGRPAAAGGLRRLPKARGQCAGPAPCRVLRWRVRAPVAAHAFPVNAVVKGACPCPRYAENSPQQSPAAGDHPAVHRPGPRSAGAVGHQPGLLPGGLGLLRHARLPGHALLGLRLQGRGRTRTSIRTTWCMVLTAGITISMFFLGSIADKQGHPHDAADGLRLPAGRAHRVVGRRLVFPETGLWSRPCT